MTVCLMATACARVTHENEMAAKRERTVGRRMTAHSLIAESFPNTVSFASYVWSCRIPIVKGRNWVKSPSREVKESQQRLRQEMSERNRSPLLRAL
jgi:hypothetical protein